MPSRARRVVGPRPWHIRPSLPAGDVAPLATLTALRGISPELPTEVPHPRGSAETAEVPSRLPVSDHPQFEGTSGAHAHTGGRCGRSCAAPPGLVDLRDRPASGP